MQLFVGVFIDTFQVYDKWLQLPLYAVAIDSSLDVIDFNVDVIDFNVAATDIMYGYKWLYLWPQLTIFVFLLLQTVTEEVRALSRKTSLGSENRYTVCCSMLQCVARCCSMLQHDTVCCSVLQCGATALSRNTPLASENK